MGKKADSSDLLIADNAILGVSISILLPSGISSRRSHRVCSHTFSPLLEQIVNI